MLNETEKELADQVSPLAEWVDLHAEALFRFAMLRVRDEHLAEDLWQETFLAALRSIDGFCKAAAIRTWLTSILNHKIIDHYRRQAKVRNTVAKHSEQQDAAQVYCSSKISVMCS
jgi:RNA polymerase sigma-70 factor (ECF subfamily)